MTSADELAIRALASTYTDAVNRGRPEECSAVYVDDGILRGPGIEPVVGRAAIAALLAAVFSRWEWLFQVTPNGIVNINGDRATSRFLIVEHGRGLDGRGTEFFGFYQDRVVRTADGWRFKERTVHTVYFGLCERPGKRHPLPDLDDPWLRS
jgi:ketosteroid isomerase-like protein